MSNFGPPSYGRPPPPWGPPGGGLMGPPPGGPPNLMSGPPGSFGGPPRQPFGFPPGAPRLPGPPPMPPRPPLMPTPPGMPPFSVGGPPPPPPPFSAAQQQPGPPGQEKFNQFYTEVKAIEARDSVLTPTQQIERLLRPGSTYFNLNPFEVLQVDPELPLSDMKKAYRRLSILVHPDKNPDNTEKAQKAFEAVSKAWKMVEDETELQKAKEVIEEAKIKTDAMLKEKRKKAKKETGSERIDEDDPIKLKHATYVMTCKLFADLERLKKDQDQKHTDAKKRKLAEEADEAERKRMHAEWEKNYEESRTERVTSWRDFSQKRTKSKKHKDLRPPKPKPEKRE